MRGNLGKLKVRGQATSASCKLHVQYMYSKQRAYSSFWGSAMGKLILTRLYFEIILILAFFSALFLTALKKTTNWKDR